MYFRLFLCYSIVLCCFVNHLVTTCIITYRIKMINFNGMLFLMLNPLRIFWKLFFFFFLIYCRSTLMRWCVLVTQAEKQLCGFLSSSSGSCQSFEPESWTSLLSFPNLRLEKKTWLKICKIYGEKPALFHVMHCCVCLSNISDNSDVFRVKKNPKTNALNRMLQIVLAILWC